MKTAEVIETLNDLIEICNDGTQGFIACAENASIESITLKNFLIDRARECTRASDELGKLVWALGGAPTTGTSTSAALHRGWLNVKTAIAGKKDRAVLEECERGEDVAKSVYQKALAKNLPESVRNIVDQQYQGVLRNHDLVKKLRNEARIEEHH